LKYKNTTGSWLYLATLNINVKPDGVFEAPEDVTTIRNAVARGWVVPHKEEPKDTTVSIPSKLTTAKDKHSEVRSEVSVLPGVPGGTAIVPSEITADEPETPQKSSSKKKGKGRGDSK